MLLIVSASLLSKAPSSHSHFDMNPKCYFCFIASIFYYSAINFYWLFSKMPPGALLIPFISSSTRLLAPGVQLSCSSRSSDPDVPSCSPLLNLLCDCRLQFVLLFLSLGIETSQDLSHAKHAGPLGYLPNP